MKAPHRRWVARVGLVVVTAAIGLPARAHFECPNGETCTIGEYRVTLNSVTIEAFAAGFLGDANADVIVKTFVQGETHGGQTAVFGQWNDTPEGTKIGIGRLMYWHLDCTPSESLQLFVDVYDEDGGLGQVVADFLKLGGGIVAAKNPGFGNAAEKAADAVGKAIKDELDKHGRFPQWDSDGFTIGDNGGTGVTRFGGDPDRDFAASVTFQYLDHGVPCTIEGIAELGETIRGKDREVDELFDRLQDSDDDGRTDQEEERLGSDVQSPASVPESHLAVEPGSCGDGIDNDADGTVDGADDGCVVADQDHDGIRDGLDNCPAVANPGQANDDWDGLGNACDPAPTQPPVGTGVPILVPSPLAGPAECAIEDRPAATALVPYFEVILADPSGLTTLLAITNARAETTLAQVTLWTDFGVPSYRFNVQLTGWDVQTLNLRDIFNGIVPMASGGAAAGAVVAGFCTPPPVQVGHLRAMHSGAASPLTGLCGGFDHGDAVLRGYVTIDVVERCEPVFPSDPGYFARGENRVASDDNALLVDYFLVSAGGGFAQGEQAVHIRADAAAFEPGDYTFYGRFVGGDGSDARQPLGRQFSTRYFAAGTAFDGATSLLVWRDPKSASAVALPCGTTPPWYPLPNGVDRLFDEEENVVILEPQGAPHQMPLATQRLVVGGLALPTPFPVGWTVVSLDHGGGDLYGDRAQGWVSAVLEATGGAFSVGFHGGILQSACGPDTIPRMSAEPVVE